MTASVSITSLYTDFYNSLQHCSRGKCGEHWECSLELRGTLRGFRGPQGLKRCRSSQVI